MRDDHSHFVVLEGFEPSQIICVAKVIHFLEMASDISYFLFRFARFLAISRHFVCLICTFRAESRELP